MLDFLKDFFFPVKCVGCGREGEYLCADCVNFLKTVEPICPHCKNLAPGGLRHFGCYTPHGLNGLTSIFEYCGVCQKTIIKLKYKFVEDLAETIVEMFLSFCGEDKGFVHFCRGDIVLVPVPLHWQRKNWRGFNQAEIVGKMIAQKLGFSFVPDLLIRKKKTKPQTKLKKKQRNKNIAGAFLINKELNINRKLSIILFDDVWTTGATLKECGKVLKRNGFKKVWGLTLARKIFRKKR